jgi:hypothetical protein
MKKILLILPFLILPQLAFAGTWGYTNNLSKDKAGVVTVK